MNSAPEPALLELLRGSGAHADPLACVEDLNAEIAGRQVHGFPHSIWQQLCHMNYWMDYELRRIQGKKPAYPEHAAGSWEPDAQPAGESEWRKEVNRFVELIGEYSSLARSAPEDLHREIELTHVSEKKNSSTLSAVLWQMVAHNSYHTGQIVMLRRALGVWPPRAGGDTW